MLFLRLINGSGESDKATHSTMKLYCLQCKNFPFVVFGKVRLAVFFGRCRNIFLDKDVSAPLEKNARTPMPALHGSLNKAVLWASVL